MISITAAICAASLNCTHVGDINMPFRYIGRRYDTSRACYIRGQFFRRCPRVHPVYQPPVVVSTPIYIHPYYR